MNTTDTTASPLATDMGLPPAPLFASSWAAFFAALKHGLGNRPEPRAETPEKVND